MPVDERAIEASLKGRVQDLHEEAVIEGLEGGGDNDLDISKLVRLKEPDFDDEEDTDEAGNKEGEETTEADAKAATAATDKDEEAEGESSESENAELTRLREEHGNLIRMLTETPGAVLEALLPNMDDKARSAILSRYGVTQAQEASEDGKFRPQHAMEEYSDAEALAVKHADWLQSGEKQLTRLQSAAADEFKKVGQALTQTNTALEYHVARLEAILEGVLEHNGLVMPTADEKAIEAAYRRGVSIRDATKEIMGRAVKATTAKARREKPTTPRGSTDELPVFRGRTLKQITDYTEKYGVVPP